MASLKLLTLIKVPNTKNLWTKTIEGRQIKISMDGKGRATDNIWIERFWKTVKYNYLTFNPAEIGLDLYRNVEYFVNYYNNRKTSNTRIKTK